MKYANPLVISIFSAIPYLLVAWGYMKLTNGDAKAFWVALGVLLGVRLFFSLIEMLGGILAWRLCGRSIVLDNALKFLKANDYPPRKYPHDDFLGYVSRIQDDPEYPVPLRKSAFEIERLLAMFEQLGILIGARTGEVWDAALGCIRPQVASDPPPLTIVQPAF